MLERATACLKHGAARQSQKLGHRFAKSRRMLHSMFWNHGAGDLDLPPWAVSMFPFPSDLQSTRDNIRRGQQKTQRSIQSEYLRSSSAAFEGVFLDFLYPPQALAWLQRAQAQQWQRWERRNARRLPNGFIVAARGYASQPQQPQSKSTYAEFVDMAEALRESEVNQRDERNNSVSPASPEQKERLDGESGAVSEPTSAKSPMASNFQPLGNDVPSDSEPPRQNEAISRERPIVQQEIDNSMARRLQDEQPSNSTIEELPSIIFEPISSTPAASDTPPKDSYDEVSMQRLRNLMNASRSGHAKNSTELTVNAIEAYDSLDKGSKDDHRLKRELMEWLSMQPNKKAVSKTIALFKDIPVAQRTFQTYSVMLAIALHRKNHEWFDRIHNETLQNLENGYQVSRTMFRRAVEADQWKIAMQIEEAHYGWYKDTSQIELFWIHVSEIPQLLLKAIELVKYFPTRKVPPSDQLESQRRFTSTFFKAAVSQEFLRSDGDASFRDAGPGLQVQRRYIRRVFEHLSQQGEASLLRSCLLEMVRDDSGFDYSQFHEVVSFVFDMYIDMPDARPPEALFTLLLRRLVEYHSVARRPSPTNSGNRGRTRNSVSIPDLLRAWKKHYDILPKDAVKSLMTYHARFGRLDLYEPWLEYLRSNYPNYEDQKDILFTMIWVHARRAELGKAQEAFAEVKRVMSENSDQPDIRCWNMLLHAHARADDLEGALTNLQNLVKYGGVTPDKRTVHGILQMLGQRGDVEGVEDVLHQYDDLRGGKRHSAHLFSLMFAHVNNNDVQAAEKILQEAVPRARNGEINGPLVLCFNLLLMAYSRLRSIDDTMRTYRWMKEENIEPDANSYAHIIKALTLYRRAQEAYTLMKKVMPKNNVKPTAVHYGILMAGFLRTGEVSTALQVYDEMSRKGIRPTVTVRAAYLKAKATAEYQRLRRGQVNRSEPWRLDETMKELERFLRISGPAELAQHHPETGLDASTRYGVQAAYVDYLVVIHGTTQCMEAVQQLHREFLEASEKGGGEVDVAPIRLLASFASAFWRNRKHKEVEKCWILAKEQADKEVALTTAAQLQVLSGDTPENEASKPAPHSIEDAASSDVSENGNAITAAELDQDQDQDTSELNKPPPRRQIAPARRRILTNNLRYYLLSLHSQGRVADSIKTVIGIIKEGYTMDNKTWNTFIELLCQTSPPLALLAYVLTERFLTPNFPGWHSVIEYPPRPQAVFEGLQYIKARYLAPGQLMPRYPTLVWLGGALLQLRKSIAVGGNSSGTSLPPELKKYVGSVDLIRRHAPKTLQIVQTIPRVPDKFQTTALRA